MGATTKTKAYPRVDIQLTNPKHFGAIKTLTREEWLQAGINGLKEMFAEIGETIPEVYVSVGFPKGARGKGKAIGICHPSAQSSDEKAHIFIHPELVDSARVLDVLAHELIHALDNCQSGHKGNFARVATAFGLEGKMTATVAGSALTARLNALIESLGAYPHAVLIPTGKKQSTRLVKCECTECGYIVRTTRKWVDIQGAPFCPCNLQQMKASTEEPEDEDGDEG
jgi:hypothetical protein